jgi:aryl-alcohol dehydrogenase-like predicted oxidoreductase
MERRSFLQAAAGVGVIVAGSTARAASTAENKPESIADSESATEAAITTPADPSDLMFTTDPGERRGEMLYRKLGATGEMVSAIGMGGAHLGRPPVSDEATAVKLIHAAIDRGINFMDNSWDYNHGQSEMNMGAALAQGGYRNKAFLMTKIDGRTKIEAARQIDTSLQRLRTDHIDLLQHHEIIRFDDPDRVFGEGGSMEAFLDAKKAGKIRYIGFTGHKDPRIHLYMLEVAARHGFHFDTVQMPLNVMDAHFRSFAHLVMPRAVQEKIGVLGMKTFGDGVLLKAGAQLQPIDYLHYSLNLPTSVVITGIDKPEILDQAFEAVKTFKPMDRQQVAELLSRTKEYAMAGKYELFKTSSVFDSTAKHPDWLGDNAPDVLKIAPAGMG